MVMAAGVGSRLEPLTCNIPKPMVPVVNRPAMEHIIELLKHHGIFEVVANLWYLPQVIEGYFGDGRDFGIKLEYSREDTLLGTAGGLRRARRYFDETFVLIAGDALTDIDLTDLVQFHRAKRALATIALKPVDDPSRFGVVVTEGDGRIVRFQEKPGPGEAASNLANTMIYVFEPGILDFIPGEGTPDFGRDVFPRLVAEEVSFYGCPISDYWCDIGTLAQYRRAHYDVLAGKVRVKMPGGRGGERWPGRGDAPAEQTPAEPAGLWIGEGARIAPDARLISPVVVGRGSEVGPGAIIGPNTVVGDGCVIDAGAVIAGSVIWSNTHVGRDARLTECVVGSECYLGSGASVGEGVVLSDECVVEDASRIKPNVKIWPGGTVKSRVSVW